jgi:hypothetical protein
MKTAERYILNFMDSPNLNQLHLFNIIITIFISARNLFAVYINLLALVFYFQDCIPWKNVGESQIVA